MCTWSDGNRYPALVKDARPDQLLLAFSNGQEHWVGKQYVTPK